jgi:hypothetical protein
MTYVFLQVVTTPLATGALLVLFTSSRACTALGQLVFVDTSAMSRRRATHVAPLK